MVIPISSALQFRRLPQLPQQLPVQPIGNGQLDPQVAGILQNFRDTVLLNPQVNPNMVSAINPPARPPSWQTFETAQSDFLRNVPPHLRPQVEKHINSMREALGQMLMIRHKELARSRHTSPPNGQAVPIVQNESDRTRFFQLLNERLLASDTDRGGIIRRIFDGAQSIFQNFS